MHPRDHRQINRRDRALQAPAQRAIKTIVNTALAVQPASPHNAYYVGGCHAGRAPRCPLRWRLPPAARWLCRGTAARWASCGRGLPHEHEHEDSQLPPASVCKAPQDPLTPMCLLPCSVHSRGAGGRLLFGPHPLRPAAGLPLCHQEPAGGLAGWLARRLAPAWAGLRTLRLAPASAARFAPACRCMQPAVVALPRRPLAWQGVRLLMLPGSGCLACRISRRR